MGKHQKKRFTKRRKSYLKRNMNRKVRSKKKNNKKIWSDRISSAILVVSVIEIPQKICESVKFIINLF